MVKINKGLKILWITVGVILLLGFCIWAANVAFFVGPPRQPTTLDKFETGQQLDLESMTAVHTYVLCPVAESEVKTVVEQFQADAYEAFQAYRDRSKQFDDLQFADVKKTGFLPGRIYLLEDSNIVDLSWQYRFDETKLLVKDGLVLWKSQSQRYWD